jgi:UDP-GlcNAc3NAcA epimerase
VLVYGDTNSTLAGALAAAKLHVPVAHVEAGLRSFDRTMPEEVNRVLTDHLSSLLFCPTATAVENLERRRDSRRSPGHGRRHGRRARVQPGRAAEQSTVLDRFGLSPGGYLLLTVHRASNTDDPAVLGAILEAVGEADLPVVFPVHPRTRHAIAAHGLDLRRTSWPWSRSGISTCSGSSSPPTGS